MLWDLVDRKGSGLLVIPDILARLISTGFFKLLFFCALSLTVYTTVCEEMMNLTLVHGNRLKPVMNLDDTLSSAGTDYYPAIYPIFMPSCVAQKHVLFDSSRL